MGEQPDIPDELEGANRRRDGHRDGPRLAEEAGRAGTADPDLTNNSATDTDTPIAVPLAPAALAVDTAGNGVYEPSETVVVAPTWRNTGTSAIAATGALANHTGPAGPTYSIPDGTASYGTIAAGGIEPGVMPPISA